MSSIKPPRIPPRRYSEAPRTPAGRKRVPSNTPYTRSWPRTSPDILDKLKALVLRFIDWFRNLPGSLQLDDIWADAPPAPGDKHIAGGEHMATLGELFDEVDERPEPPRPNEPPGWTSAERQPSKTPHTT